MANKYYYIYEELKFDCFSSVLEELGFKKSKINEIIFTHYSDWRETLLKDNKRPYRPHQSRTGKSVLPPVVILDLLLYSESLEQWKRK